MPVKGTINILRLLFNLHQKLNFETLTLQKNTEKLEHSNLSMRAA